MTKISRKVSGVHRTAKTGTEVPIPRRADSPRSVVAFKPLANLTGLRQLWRSSTANHYTLVHKAAERCVLNSKIGWRLEHENSSFGEDRCRCAFCTVPDGSHRRDVRGKVYIGADVCGFWCRPAMP